MKIGRIHSKEYRGDLAQFVHKDCRGNVTLQRLEVLPSYPGDPYIRFTWLWPRIKVPSMDFVREKNGDRYRLAAPEIFGDGVLSAGEFCAKQAIKRVAQTAFSMIKGFNEEKE